MSSSLINSSTLVHILSGLVYVKHAQGWKSWNLVQFMTHCHEYIRNKMHHRQMVKICLFSNYDRFSIFHQNYVNFRPQTAKTTCMHWHVAGRAATRLKLSPQHKPKAESHRNPNLYTDFPRKPARQEFLLATVVNIIAINQPTLSCVTYSVKYFFSLTVPFTWFHLILCNTGAF